MTSARLEVRCPFHDARLPEMLIGEGVYHCFGCGASGAVADLEQHVEQSLDAERKRMMERVRAITEATA